MADHIQAKLQYLAHIILHACIKLMCSITAMCTYAGFNHEAHNNRSNFLMFACGTYVGGILTFKCM